MHAAGAPRRKIRIFGLPAALAAAMLSVAAARAGGLEIAGINLPNATLHFLGGAASGLFVAAALSGSQEGSLMQQYPLYLPAAAVAASLAAGMGKEFLDSTGFGDAAFADILTTFTGGIVGAGVVAFAEAAARGGGFSQGNAAALFLSTAALFTIPVALGFVAEIERYRQRAYARAQSG